MSSQGSASQLTIDGTYTFHFENFDLFIIKIHHRYGYETMSENSSLQDKNEASGSHLKFNLMMTQRFGKRHNSMMTQRFGKSHNFMMTQCFGKRDNLMMTGKR